MELVQKKEEELPKAHVLGGQPCPFCRNQTLSLTEAERDIPYFGNVFIFSMTCTSCKYHKSDVECAENKEPSRYTFELCSTEDLNVRVVKSSEAIVKIPFIMNIEPGESSQGYVTNIEGLLNRVKSALEIARQDAEEESEKKKIKNMLKKLHRAYAGQEPLKIIIEDKTGNSAIISERAERKAI